MIMMGREALTWNVFVLPSVVIISCISCCCCSPDAAGPSSSSLTLPSPQSSLSSSSSEASYEPDQTQAQQLEQQRLKELRDQWLRNLIYPYVLSHEKGSPMSSFPAFLLNMSPQDNSKDIIHRIVNNNMNIDEGSSSSSDNILDSSAKSTNPLAPLFIPGMRDGRVMIVRYGDHGSLRRGLRAVTNKNGLYRGRRYKAQADTNFIRFGRSSPTGTDDEREDDDSEQQTGISQEDINVMDKHHNNNSFDRKGFFTRFPYSLPSSGSMMSMMSKKARPDKYYLRFGKRSVSPESVGEESLVIPDELYSKSPSLVKNPTHLSSSSPVTTNP